MRVLTVAETAGWLKARDLTLVPAKLAGSDHQVVVPPDFESRFVGVPQDARSLLNLAHLLSSSYAWQSSVVVVCVVTGFQDYELDAFLSFRRLYGDTRWVDGVPGGATPGQLLSATESQAQRDVREMLAFMLAYTFEGYFILDHGQTILWAGDDVLDIASSRNEDLQVADNTFATLGLGPTDWARELMARRRTKR